MNGSFSGEIFVETNYFLHLIPHEAKLSNSLLFSKKNKIWHQSGKNAWSTKEPTLGLPSLQQPRWFNGLVFHTRIKTNPFPNCHNVLNLMNSNWTDTSTFPAVTRGTFWKWTLFLPLQKLLVDEPLWIKDLSWSPHILTNSNGVVWRLQGSWLLPHPLRPSCPWLMFMLSVQWHTRVGSCRRERHLPRLVVKPPVWAT